jgi:hypothetical protein
MKIMLMGWVDLHMHACVHVRYYQVILELERDL